MTTTRGGRFNAVLGGLAAILSLALALTAWADDHDGGKRERRRERGGKDCLTPVASPAYREACGGCHFVLQPGLLPAASWRAVMGGLGDHFGEPVDLDPAARSGIEAYLTANAADREASKISRKIMKNLGGAAPLRVTETPYWRHKHEDDEVPPGAFQRKSVGSPANCLACHPGADQGCYDDDAVSIPR